MKLASFENAAGRQTGVVTGDTITPTGVAGTMIDIIANWEALKPDVVRNTANGVAVPLSSVQLLAPVLRPGKVFAIGLNYADHIAESKMATPEHQVWFTKAVTSINGPYAPILIGKTGPFVDYEIELVAIIGKGGKHISRERAHEHVFGYCVGNDVTERLWQHTTAQWSLGKSFDTHAPIGPWITTADEIPDPHALDLRCFVNGDKRQESNTRHLVFDVWAQIAHLSQAMTLEPGDVIFTGTPAGIGATMDPRQFLQPGDVLRSEIDGLGVMEATLVAEV
jgi:2-keto-4-pentenoate hydratase/2-oxohepta-3-ene-1,7-dioic acid hydratase in catechol pathway